MAACLRDRKRLRARCGGCGIGADKYRELGRRVVLLLSDRHPSVRGAHATASACVQALGRAMNPRNVPGLNSKGSCMPLVGRPSAPTHAVRAHAPLSAHGTQRCAYSMRGVGVKLAQPSASLELATKGIRSGAYGQAGRGTKQVRCSCLRCPAVSPPCAVGNPQSESEVTTRSASKATPIRTQIYHSRPKESCGNGMGATSARTVCILR